MLFKAGHFAAQPVAERLGKPVQPFRALIALMAHKIEGAAEVDLILQQAHQAGV